MSWAEEQLSGYIAAGIMQPSATPSEIKFWSRVARKAVYIMRTSPTHALIPRPRATPRYECWVWDGDMKELVLMKGSLPL